MKVSFVIRTLLYRLRPFGFHAVPSRVFPHDAPEAHTSGPDPVTVLLVGGDILRGWGVATHDLAVPGHLARALSGRTGRGTNVLLELTERDNLASVVGALRHRDLWDVDAIVLHVGLRDVGDFTSPVLWSKRLTGLLGEVLSRTRDGVTVTVVGVPLPSRVPFLKARAGGQLDVQAQKINGASQTVCAATGDAFFMPAPVYVPGPELSGQFGRPGHYQYWAKEEAEHLVPLLPAAENSSVEAPARRLPSKADRQRRQTQAPPEHSSDTHERVRAVLHRAVTVFGVETAMYTTARGDHLVVHTSHGDIRTIPVEKSFCAVTLGQCGTVVIEDTSNDERLKGEHPALFYAGHPLTAPDGTRIGTFCVIAETTRSPNIDPVIFRDFALQIQKEL